MITIWSSGYSGSTRGARGVAVSLILVASPLAELVPWRDRCRVHATVPVKRIT
jgi:hypothetical protein